MRVNPMSYTASLTVVIALAVTSGCQRSPWARIDPNPSEVRTNPVTSSSPEVSFDIARHPGLLCAATIEKSPIKRGGTSKCLVTIKNSSRGTLSIPGDMIGHISVCIRETDELFQLGFVASAKPIAGVEMRPGATQEVSFTIFTRRDQKYPEGPKGPIGWGPLIAEPGRYTLQFIVYGMPASEVMFIVE